MRSASDVPLLPAFVSVILLPLVFLSYFQQQLDSWYVANFEWLKILENAYFVPLLGILWYLILVLPTVGLLYFKPQLINEALVRPERQVSWKDITKCLLNLVVNQFLFFSLATFGFITESGKIELPEKAPKIGKAIAELAFCLVLFDLVFFLGHKLLHRPWFFKNIHYVHHRFNTTNALVSQYLHPVEALILGLTGMLPPFIINLHPLVNIVWILMITFIGMEHHSGLQFSFYDLHKLSGGVYAGSRWHDTHHAKPNKNFSALFTYCDVLWGRTDSFAEEAYYLKLVPSWCKKI